MGLVIGVFGVENWMRLCVCVLCGISLNLVAGWFSLVAFRKGYSVSGSTSVSKTARSGSNPDSPAKIQLILD